MSEKSTEALIEELQQLDGNKISDEPKPSAEKSDDEEKSAKENKLMCRLLHMHLREFFEDLYIPFNFFKEGGWNISKVLYDNEDVLFYNKKYITDTDEDKFYEVFYRLMEMLEEIFTPDNKLYGYLKAWTDMSDSRWRTSRIKPYLKKLLTERKFQYISPSYTANLFYDNCVKYNHDLPKVKIETENHLNGIMKQLKIEIKEFKEVYNDIIASYVYEYPHHTNEKSLYVKAFLNGIILAIIDFAEKLLKLHIFAVHPIVNEIIEYYIPLDEINYYDPRKNGNRHLCIV